MDLVNIKKEILEEMTSNFKFEEIPEDEYTYFSYPKLIKIMKFETRRYRIHGFGHYMTLHTTGPFINLVTASFMPSEGSAVPFFLIDMMTVGKKRTVFIEFYDCTFEHPDMSELKKNKEIYDNLPEYEEKPNWYVKERSNYSLIKCGTPDDDEKLHEMILESVKAYIKEIKKAPIDKKNLPDLKAFRTRMIKEGNPSTPVLQRVFGKEGTEEYFIKCVMPDVSDE